LEKKMNVSTQAFDMTQLFAQGLPAPAARFGGFPKYNFIGGHNDPTQIPVDALIEAITAIMRREGPNLAIYNMGHGPQGYGGLREMIAKKLSGHRGIKCTADDVLVLSGSGQGIEMVTRLLVNPGETVLVEEFSYGGAISRIKKEGALVVGMPLDEDGIRPDALATILEDHKQRGVSVKYLYTIPTIQNPTGSIMPLARRQEILALACQYGVPIFEDECYADLTWAGEAPPAFAALDPKQVIHIGSFSKTLAPALRVGYAVAEWPILSRLIAMKTDGGTGALNQMVVAEYFGGHFESHVTNLSNVLKDKLEVMIDALDKEFGTAIEMWRPAGGIFLWLKFPDAVDTSSMLKAAGEAGIAYNAGPEWACDPGSAKPYMRLCFALPSKEDIRAGVSALAKVCHEQTGIPERSGNVDRSGS
jgi:2-aminoadipate transaminase